MSVWAPRPIHRRSGKAQQIQTGPQTTGGSNTPSARLDTSHRQLGRMDWIVSVGLARFELATP
jgi:hypothetical protein